MAIIRTKQDNVYSLLGIAPGTREALSHQPSAGVLLIIMGILLMLLLLLIDIG